MASDVDALEASGRPPSDISVHVGCIACRDYGILQPAVINCYDLADTKGVGNTLYGYQADFVHEGKMGMLLSREHPIHSDELDPHQFNMLRHNVVPHFLPLEIQEIDFEVTFLYDISGKKMLHQVLRTANMTSIQYFEWMLQLVRVLEECRTYLLYPNHILLHEQFIYVDSHAWNGSLYVPYIPTLEPLHPQAGMDGLRRLGILLSSHVSNWNGDGFQRLIQILSLEDKSLVDVRRLLQSLIIGSPEEKDNPSTWKDNANTTNDVQQVSSPFYLPDKASNSVADDARKESPVELAWPATAERIRKGSTDEAVQEDTASSVKKHTIIVTGAVIVAAALGWRYSYMSSPSAASLAVSLIWSVVVVGIGGAWLSGWIAKWSNRWSKRRGAAAPAEEQAPASTFDVISNKDMALPDFLSMELRGSAYSAEATRQGDTLQPESVHPSEYHAQATHSGAAYYDSLSQYTSMLSESQGDATVMLGQDAEPAQTTAGIQGPHLQKMNEAGSVLPDRIILALFPFTIGRAEQGVHLRDEGIGVSKHHCEVVHTEEGGCAIRDLGSKNGTELQGELLIPYKLYPLKDGDTVAIARSVYIYRAG
ncbi:DUF6382 domain-containing protein [Paenibacillus profundus]|uniref:DUF6382 domain-containing protein n=1 Tax=Paenibacillus profundus TaxID=1173085 RepID=A0ABS8YA82_9BACL|nr:DUF6382 domain-containing protein [Paenibacillus profundus]